MKQKISESVVQKQIIQYLAYNHFFYFRNNSGAIKVENRLVRFGQVGSADIVAVKGGKVYFIECKSPTGKLRDSQKMWLQEAEDHGAICIVAHSLEEFMLKLKDERS